MMNKPAVLARVASGCVGVSLFLASCAANCVELYGIVDAYVGSTKPSGAAKSTIGVESGGMTTSFWGLTGTEDLGDGLMANFRLEGYFLTDTGASGRSPTDTMLSRNAYVGLEKANIGEVRLGRLRNPFFLATTQFDPYGSSTKFSPLQNPLWVQTFGRYVAGDSGWNNAVGYYTPDFGGLSGRFLYSLGETAGTNSTNNFGAMLYVDRGKFTATAAFQRVKTGPGLPIGSWAQDAFTLGTAYDFGVVKGFLEYVGTRTSGGTKRSTDSFQIGATYPIFNGKIMASVVQTNIRPEGQADFKRRNYAIGYLYPLSKRSDLYANVLYDKLSNSGGGISTGFGMRHKF
ncbi:porin [Cupriavidus sp. 8B]